MSASCEHLVNYKKNKGDSAYRIIHAHFVTCLTKNSLTRKANEVFCHDCETKLNRIHACLTCVYFGCFDNGHIGEHARKNNHDIAMDVTYGNLFCFRCNDYMYDEHYEIISKEQKVKAGWSEGIETYIPWEPENEEIELIKENGGFRKIVDNSLVGLRGLVNLGHTCFMNCILQVLIHTPLLRNYFLSDKHICQFENSETCLACEMFHLYQEFYSGKSAPHIPHKLVYLIWMHAKHLAGFDQQDAHECLIAILDVLHKQCKNAEENKMFANSVSRCGCVIHQIFTGYYQSDVKCLDCKHLSTTIEPFWDISLNIGGTDDEKEQSTISLEDCLKSYTQPEHLPSSCHCKGSSRMKQLTVKKLPVVTCFHLKRLEHSSGLHKKNSAHIEFREFLDMSPFLSTVCSAKVNLLNEDMISNVPSVTINNSESKFTLFAVVTHSGTDEGGHYVSYIRQHRDKWYQCNDDVITKSSIEQVLASEGYLLFYHKQVLEYGVNVDLQE